LELADRPHRLEVAEEKTLMALVRCGSLPTCRKLGAHVIAAVSPGQTGNGAAHALEPCRQFGAAAIDGHLVRGRRLEADERLDRVDEPGTLATAEILEVYNRAHDYDKDTT